MAAFAEWKGWKAASGVLAAAVATYFIYFAITRPAVGWDVVAYTMAALKDGALRPDGTVDIVTLHARTWAALRSFLGDAALLPLTQGTSYLETQYRDPAALASQLPLYESKYGYVLLLKALAPVMEPPRAVVTVSLVATLGILALLVRAAWRLEGIATLAWLPIALLFGLGSYASMMSPDAAFALAGVAGIAALLSQRLWPAVACFIAAVLLRPDGLVLSLVICAALAVRRQRGAALALLAGSAAAYAVNVLVSHHVGWWAQFHVSFLGQQNVLTGFQPAFDPGLYARFLLTQVSTVAHVAWMHAAVAAVLLAVVLLRASEEGAWGGVLLAALVAGAVLRFLPHPTSEIRFYAPYLFGIGLIVLHAAARRERA